MTTSIKTDVIELLSQHHLTPETLLIKLETEPTVTLESEQKQKWIFVSRHRCRRYLMAKCGESGKLEEIYSKNH